MAEIISDSGVLDGVMGHKSSTIIGFIAYISYQVLSMKYPQVKVLVGQVINAPETIPLFLAFMAAIYKGK